MKIGSHTIARGKPSLMGIVNVTPDSFSDEGRFFDSESAIEHSLDLIDDGVDILDIGGESTRPGALGVSADEELLRTIPVIEGIRRHSSIPISIDTTKAAVAKAAIESGTDMINDISAGRFDGEMLSLAASSKKPICLMHMQGTPRTMQDNPHYDDLIGDIGSFLRSAAKRAIGKGVGKDNIILDPGIGFGKSAEENMEILRNLITFSNLGYPLLIGASNKSFIGKLLDLEVKERLEATLATIPISIEGGASIIRVHDVRSARRFLDMYLLLTK